MDADWYVFLDWSVRCVRPSDAVEVFWDEVVVVWADVVEYDCCFGSFSADFGDKGEVACLVDTFLD